jgi:hypothetical protein
LIIRDPARPRPARTSVTVFGLTGSGHVVPFDGRGATRPSAPESAHQQWGESPHRTEHWLSVDEGNCVVERRGGEQPEANCQSINKTMLNTIRPDALASLLGKGEAQNRKPTREGARRLRQPLRRQETVSARAGMHEVGGDRMAGSWSDMNQGSRAGKGTAFMVK